MNLIKKKVMIMNIDISNEIIYQTARSGGKGGQNVNKVESMVEGRWSVMNSVHFNEDQKLRILTQLHKKITKDGYLLVKSQIYRTQLENKTEVLEKMTEMISTALVKKKARIASKPSRSSQLKRLESKKRHGLTKQNRKPFFD